MRVRDRLLVDLINLIMRADIHDLSCILAFAMGITKGKPEVNTWSIPEEEKA